MKREKGQAQSLEPSSESADLGTRIFELAVRKWNLGPYLLGAVGLAAGVAVILRFTSGTWMVPLIGAPSLFVFVAIIRIFAPAPDAPRIPHQGVMQAVIGWTCVMVLLGGIGIGMWWVVRTLFRDEKPVESTRVPTTSDSAKDALSVHEGNLNGTVYVSGKTVEGATVRVANGICRFPVSVTTGAGGSFSADCEQTNLSDVIVLLGDWDQNGKHCHAETDSSKAYKITDRQNLELTCDSGK